MQREIDQLKEELAKELIRLRKETTGLSEYQMAKELNMGYDTLYKIESMKSLPSKRMLSTLFVAYKMNRNEFNKLMSLRKRIIELRKQDKKVV